MLKRIKSYLINNYNYLIFSFFFVGVICWVLEMIYAYITMDRLVVPGVMYGPFLPIYGSAYIILLLIFNEDDKLIVNATKTFFAVSIVEYISSFLSDRFFDHIIWDYSDEFLNINGRICLEMSLIFMVLGLFFMYVLDPRIRKVYDKLKKNIKTINKVLIEIFIFDLIMHFIV